MRSSFAEKSSDTFNASPLTFDPTEKIKTFGTFFTILPQSDEFLAMSVESRDNGAL